VSVLEQDLRPHHLHTDEVSESSNTGRGNNEMNQVSMFVLLKVWIELICKFRYHSKLYFSWKMAPRTSGPNVTAQWTALLHFTWKISLCPVLDWTRLPVPKCRNGTCWLTYHLQFIITCHCIEQVV